MTTFKKLFLLGLAALSFTAYSQDETVDPIENKVKEVDVTYVSEKAVLPKYHNEVELDKLGKLELTALYIERVKILTEIVPYLALNKKPAGADLDDLGVPETKSNVADLEREVKSKESYLANIGHTLHDVVPYADKKNIIWAILFMEDTIHKAEKAALDQ
jgi:hypothetical protein